MAGPIARLSSDVAAELGRLRLAGPRAAAGSRAALASLAAILVALALDLDNPWWAGITGLVLVQQSATATLLRSIDRVIGTIAGAGLGYAAAATIDDHLVFELVCVATTAFTVYAQARAQRSYAILLGGVTVLLVLFGSLQNPGEALHLAFYRAAEIIVGVVVATFIDITLSSGPQAPAPPAAAPGIWSRPVDLDLAAAALSGGIAVALIPPVWNGLQLPGLAQTPITAFVILSALRKDPQRKAAFRALGCLVGGLYGLAMMPMVGDAFLPWLAALGCGLFVSGNLAHGETDASYVGVQSGVAMILAMVQGGSPSPDILSAIDRLAGIFGGIVLVAVCDPILRPSVRRVLGPGNDGAAA